ncbi:MAG: hypothetical protein K0R65_1820 [Crocinitomicaceae bacterium]|jgi:gliding motility-associated-like protein|nr:hypothetical protein [Crocinitomicaceae bacterium]
MRYLLHIAFLLAVQLSFGQLTTSTTLSPSALVQNVMLGPGVEVSNVQFTGSPQAIGRFNYTGSVFGIADGIVLTTGTVFNTGQGPQGPNDEDASGIDNSAGGAAILESLIGSNLDTYNAAILQFDFTAVGDEVSFRYIFGSEEYLEFVDEDYNDVFGLFISGPGIIGNQNIAKLPNQTVVMIDNVNSQQNSAYYVDNGDGNDSPYNSNPQFIQYDGYTKVLTATSPVQCGQMYHLTIAIADVGDKIVDSGVFLEAQSLTSIPPVEVEFESSGNYFGDPSVFAEGCTTGTFTVNRVDATTAVNVPITVSGTSTAGVDFSNTIPSSLSFAVGQTSASFDFNTIADALAEGSESLNITFFITDPCGDIIEEEFNLQIRDVQPVVVTLSDHTINCEDPNFVTLIPQVTGGLQPYTFSWSTGETSPSITVSPSATTTYSVTVTDFCTGSTGTDDAVVTIPAVIPLIVDPIADVTENCPYVVRSFEAFASGGGGAPYTYSWERAGEVLGTSSVIDISPSSTAVYDLTVRDRCGVETTVSFTYTVLTALLVPAINTPEIICPGDSVELRASATLGFGEYSYVWVHTNDTSPNVWVKPAVTTTYRVFVSDECNTYSVPIATTVPVHTPNASFTYNSSAMEVNSPIQFVSTTPGGVSFVWDLGNGESSILPNPVTTYPDMGEYVVTLIAVDAVGCIDTVSRTIMIGTALYIPNTFTPDGNRFNNEFEPVGYNVRIISFEIYDRWGELIFFSTTEGRFSWDGTYKGKPVQDGVYTYRVRYREPNEEEFVKIGHVTLLR